MDIREKSAVSESVSLDSDGYSKLLSRKNVVEWKEESSSKESVFSLFTFDVIRTQLRNSEEMKQLIK